MAVIRISFEFVILLKYQIKVSVWQQEEQFLTRFKPFCKNEKKI
jgi:hypothetical protein